MYWFLDFGWEIVNIWLDLFNNLGFRLSNTLIKFNFLCNNIDFSIIPLYLIFIWDINAILPQTRRSTLFPISMQLIIPLEPTNLWLSIVFYFPSECTIKLIIFEFSFFNICINDLCLLRLFFENRIKINFSSYSLYPFFRIELSIPNVRLIWRKLLNMFCKGNYFTQWISFEDYNSILNQVFNI